MPHIVLKTERFGSIDSAIITKQCKQGNIKLKVLLPKFQFCTTLLTLLMMAVESMQSKRLILRNTMSLNFFLKLFLSCIYCIPQTIWICRFSVVRGGSRRK